MAELELDSLLPRGTITYEGKDHQQSTIDLTLTSSLLAEDHLRCGVYPQEHGSDHRAIEAWFNIARPEQTFKPRLLFRHARWEAISKIVGEQLQYWGSDPRDLEQDTEELIRVVLGAVKQHTPHTKPSPYTKRWWTADLTELRRNYTYWRNQARE
jgi:Endonuclease-reverse transcriptase